MWVAGGLAGLGTPARAFHDEQTATAALPAGVPEKLTKLQRKTKAAASAVNALWAVPEGSPVTEDQMRSLFGLGLHPNAVALTDALVKGKAGKAGAAAAVKLGRPFRINPDDTELNRRLAVAYRDHNLSVGKPWNTAIEDDLRAQMKTTLACELFEQQHGRAPADDRELSGFIARESRELTTSTAGYDFTFSPVKSVSALWARARLSIAPASGGLPRPGGQRRPGLPSGRGVLHPYRHRRRRPGRHRGVHRGAVHPPRFPRR